MVGGIESLGDRMYGNAGQTEPCCGVDVAYRTSTLCRVNGSEAEEHIRVPVHESGYVRRGQRAVAGQRF